MYISLQSFASAALSSALARQRRTALAACAVAHREQSNQEHSPSEEVDTSCESLQGGADLVIDLAAFASITSSALARQGDGVKSLSEALLSAARLDPTPTRHALLELMTQLADDCAAKTKASLSDARSSRRHALREAVWGTWTNTCIFLYCYRYYFKNRVSD